jgi:hypothetical protein
LEQEEEEEEEEKKKEKEQEKKKKKKKKRRRGRRRWAVKSGDVGRRDETIIIIIIFFFFFVIITSEREAETQFQGSSGALHRFRFLLWKPPGPRILFQGILFPLLPCLITPKSIRVCFSRQSVFLPLYFLSRIACFCFSNKAKMIAANSLLGFWIHSFKA